MIKLFAGYDEAFWRDEGLTGQAISNEGPVKITFDNPPPDAAVRSGERAADEVLAGLA